MAGQQEEIQIKVIADAADLSSGMQKIVGVFQQGMDNIASSITSAGTQAQTLGDKVKEGADKGGAGLRTLQGESQKSASLMEQLQSAVGNLGSQFEKIKATVGAAGIAMTTYLGSAITAAMGFQRSVVDMARVTGMSTQAAGEFAYATKRMAVDMDAFNMAIMVLSRNVMNAKGQLGEGKTKFEEWGVAITGADGKLLSTDQIMRNIMTRYKQLPSQIERNAMAQDLLGRSAKDLAKFLNLGADGLDKLAAEAKKAGVDLGNVNTAKAFIEAEKAVKTMNATIDLFKVSVGSQFLPVVTALSNAILNLLDAFNKISPEIREVGIYLATGAGLLATFWGGWAALSKILTAIGGPFTAVAGWLSKLWGLIGSGVTALGGFIATLYKTHVAWLVGMGPVGWVIGALEAVGIAIGILYTAWTNNFGGIQQTTAQALNNILAAWQQFTSALSKIGSAIMQMVRAIGQALSDPAGAAKAGAEGFQNLMAGWDNIKIALGNLASGVKDAGAAVGSSFVDGFKQSFNTLWNKVFSRKNPDVSSGEPGAGMDDDSGAGGAGKSDGADGKEETAFTKAKERYEQDIQRAEYTAAEKLAIYKKYLDGVEKSAKELVEYKIGLYRLEANVLQESLKMQEADLEISKIKEETTEKDYLAKKAAIRKASLAAEVEFEVQARMEILGLNEQEKQAQHDKIEAEVKGTLRYKEALKGVLEEEKRLAEYQREVANIMAAMASDKVKSLIEDERQRVEEERELGLISEQEKIAQLQRLTQAEYEENQKRLAFEYQNAKEGTKEYAQYLQKKQELELNYNRKMSQLSYQRFQAEHRYQLDFIKDMQDAFSNAVNGVIKGTTKLKQAFRDMGSAILNSVVNSITKPMVERFSASLTRMLGLDRQYLATKQAIDRGAKAAEVASTAQAEASKTALVTAGGQAQIAATTAAGAAATAAATTTTAANMSMLESIGTALASIPWYGWVGLAILAGVASARSASGGSSAPQATNLGRNPDSYYQTPYYVGMPSFDVGSWQLPNDMVAQVHKDEMIVPAKGGMADNVRALLSGKAALAGAAGPTVFSPSISINASAIDGRGMKKALQEAGRDLVEVLNKEYRNFNRPRR